MGDGRQSENGRHNLDYFRGTSNPWNMAAPHYQGKEPNALVMNKKIMSIIAERDAAIQDRNLAFSEKIAALAARDEALWKRDEAIAQRDSAFTERDNAVAAFQIHISPARFPSSSGIRQKNKRLSETLDHDPFANQGPCATDVRHITDALPITAMAAKIQHGKQKNTKDGSSKSQSLTRKKVGEDLNREAASDGIKYRTDFDARAVGLNLMDFVESTMQVPVCSCTGIGRRCYKWGNKGWQSSCCTITMSMYPLPHLPNKRHARMGGRKMSGSVFVRLLGRLAAEGHDLSTPVDLKDHWARHGTNRCITIR